MEHADLLMSWQPSKTMLITRLRRRSGCPMTGLTESRACPSPKPGTCLQGDPDVDSHRDRHGAPAQPFPLSVVLSTPRLHPADLKSRPRLSVTSPRRHRLLPPQLQQYQLVMAHDHFDYRHRHHSRPSSELQRDSSDGFTTWTELPRRHRNDSRSGPTAAAQVSTLFARPRFGAARGRGQDPICCDIIRISDQPLESPLAAPPPLSSFGTGVCESEYVLSV